MKELLTKKFWRDVKKTFDEAREETTLNSGASQAVSPGEAKYEVREAAEIPTPSEATPPED
jgi:hypothetical protein